MGLLKDSILSSSIPWGILFEGRLKFAKRVIGRGVGTPVRKRRKKKGRLIQLLEYLGVCFILLFARVVPFRVGAFLSERLGSILFDLLPRRRSIAVENVKRAYSNDSLNHRRLARRSFSSFVVTGFELLRLGRSLRARDSLEPVVNVSEGGRAALTKASEIHREAKGCIFATPHLGNWELLPHLAFRVGISAVVVARPLDNRYLEKLVYRRRSESGQIIVSRNDALSVLQRTLKGGKSIALLPDQGMRKGIPVPFFGRAAFTTPVPAILAVRYRRPIVVIACCRGKESNKFDVVVSEPLWPEERTSGKEEVYRLTGRMNLEMEAIIRRYPEQYLWMHDRWKRYKHRRQFLS
jgi:KDO2-lipid IV(A) lauroyltransferase